MRRAPRGPTAGGPVSLGTDKHGFREEVQAQGSRSVTRPQGGTEGAQRPHHGDKTCICEKKSKRRQARRAEE